MKTSQLNEPVLNDLWSEQSENKVHKNFMPLKSIEKY